MRRSTFLVILLWPVYLASAVFGQTLPTGPARARITERLDESRTVAVKGNVHPLAAVSASQPVDGSMRMERMVLTLEPEAQQERRLAELIAEQSNPKSPNYGRYLTPQEFGAQFGVGTADLEKVTAWLESHGFRIDEVPAGQRAIVFSGTAAQVAEAFHTEMRSYQVAGVRHLANATDPQIPAALAGVVGGVVKLHDFRHSRHISKIAPVARDQFDRPQFDAYGGAHYLAPADYASIYDISPLYSAGVDGSGQTIAILARSNISQADVQSFRSDFGLKANNPQIVLVAGDPGVLPGDSTETTLDTEWSGAVAPGATIKVIVAASTATADGIDLSALYAVNNNVAPVVSLSYGSCEQYMGTTELSFYNSLWQQAAAEGITVMVSSGDSGAAGCSGGSSAAGFMRAVNGLCSSPYATCVGGTEFVEGSNPGQYWLPGNNAAYGSAIGYIPETVWNESASDGGSGLWAAGGGASIQFAKPSWQTGTGVPADGQRDVPDVSLTAAGHDGYVIVQSGYMMAIGGTSASAPSFAGLMALVDQKMNARQGLANATLYPLASNQAAGGGAAMFHDTASGNNSVPGVTGFAAAPGYDLATGLGSVDANLLVNHWNDAAQGAAPTMSLSASAGTVTALLGQTVQDTISAHTSGALKSAVALSVAGAPAGVTAQFSSSSIAAPGSGSVTLSINVGVSATPGTYALTVTGQAGAQTATIPVSLTIPQPGFSLTASLTALSVMQSGNGQVAIARSVQNGFSAATALSVTGLPAGVTGSFSPASLTATTSSSVLAMAAGNMAKPGAYPLTITASGGGVTRSISLSMTVAVAPSCTLAASPATVKLVAGQATAVQIACGSVQGTFAGPPPALSLAGLPASLAASFTPAYLTPGTASTLSLSAALKANSGTYTLAVMAATTGFRQTLNIPVIVSTASAFTLSAAQNSLTAKPGGTAQLGVSSLHSGAFNSALALSVSGLPAGVTGAFSRSSFPAPGDGSSTLTLLVGSTAKAGIYPMVITGTGGGLSQSLAATLTVAANPDFSFAVNVSTLKLQPGGPAGTLVVSTGNFSGGFNSTITISFGGLAPGMNYGATGATTGNNLVNTSIGFTAAKTTPAGTYPITVTASGAGITHSAVVQMTVSKPSSTAGH